MLIVRLKQCETALAGGRLDEAFDLARAPDLRAHRKGQALTDRVCRAMLDRGRTHLTAGQLDAAARDCEKAAALGGNQTDIAGLRAAISHAMAEQRRDQQRGASAVAAIRQHVRQGQLSVGEQLLATATLPVDQAESLRRELSARRAALRSASEKAAAAFRAGDWEGAVVHLAGLDPAAAADPTVRELASRITAKVVARAAEAIEAGRLDMAAAALKGHAQLPGTWADADRLRDVLRQCRLAFECLNRADAAGTERIVRSLAQLWPGAKWLQAAERQARELRGTGEDLMTGPLRLAAAGASAAAPSVKPVAVAPAAAANGKPMLHVREPSAAADAHDADFVLHVDGAGAFRVIGRNAVSIGPARASRPVDVALMADASLPVVLITRSDEDYFLQSSQPVTVNDRPASHALLASGDRIGLGPRCRLRFRRPNPASASAVLDVTGARLASGDVRQIILLDRELVLGPGPAAHVRADELSAPAVLQQRDGRVECRAGDPIRIDGRASNSPAEFLAGQHVTIGPVGFVVANQEKGP